MDINDEYIKGKFIKVKKVVSPDGLPLELNDRAESVVGLIFDKEYKRVLAVRQWRAGKLDYIFEPPAGMIDDSEAPCNAMIREIAEETGYTVNENMFSLGGYYNSVGVSNEKSNLFIGRINDDIFIPNDEDIYKIENPNQNLDENERIDVYWIKYEKAKELFEGLSSRVMMLSYDIDNEKYKLIKRIGVFGGSFSPIHNSHVRIVEEAMEQFNLDEVIITPTNDRYFHRKNEHLIPFEDRSRMIEIAFKHNKNVSVSDIEAHSFMSPTTFMTCSKLKRPNSEIIFIVGMDNAIQIPEWEQGDLLLDNFNVIVYDRGIDSKSRDKLINNETISKYYNSGSLKIVSDMNTSGISSTSIRDKIRNGKSVKGIVDDSVIKYIVNNNILKKNI